LNGAAAIIGCGIGGIMLQLQSAFGIFALLALAWAFGENRGAVSIRQGWPRLDLFFAADSG